MFFQLLCLIGLCAVDFGLIFILDQVIPLALNVARGHDLSTLSMRNIYITNLAMVCCVLTRQSEDTLDYYGIVIATIIANFWFYSVHRILHIPWIYQHVHFVHHKYEHVSASIAFYAHFIELVFLNLMSVGIPVILLDLGNVTTFMFLMTAKLNAFIGHTTLIDEFHALHHIKYKFNFGTETRILDILFKTNTDSRSPRQKQSVTME